MAYYYKLLHQNMTSYDGMRWELNKPNFAIGNGNKLCSADVLHCYADPELAVVLNPIHADIPFPRLFLIRATKAVANDGTKVGTKKQTIIKELPLPVISTKVLVAFAILCACEIYHDPKFTTWAHKWLSGEDRTRKGAKNAAAYAAAAYAAAAAAAAYAATYAAAAAYDATAAAYAATHEQQLNLIQLLQKAKQYA